MVEPGLERVRKQPLDVTMIGLQQNVIALPLVEHHLNESPVRGRGHSVEVKLNVRHVHKLSNRRCLFGLVIDTNRLPLVFIRWGVSG